MTNWRQVLRGFIPGQSVGSCHGDGSRRKNSGLRKVGIVGNPNVGKSVIFNKLTGAYVTVSNYPGTTVNGSRGNDEDGGKGG